MDIRDNKAAAKAFVRPYDVPYPSLFDPNLRTALEWGALAPRAIPSTFVLDRQGRVAAFFYGAVTELAVTSIVNGVAEER